MFVCVCGCVHLSVHKCVHWLVNLYGVPAVVYKSFWNSLSTFCYLLAEGHALGQLVDGQLPIELALFGGAAELDDGGHSGHDGDEEEAHAVDQDLQIGLAAFTCGTVYCCS